MSTVRVRRCASGAMCSASNQASAWAREEGEGRSSSGSAAAPRVCRRVVAKSARRSVSSRPMAHRMPGLRGTRMRADVQLARQPCGMQRPGAAERDQRVVARVVAALHADDPDRARHVGGHDRDDALRGRHHVQPERSARRPIASLGQVLPHGHAAAEQDTRVQRLQHDVGVGDRRLRVAVAVADRPGIGPGRARPDLEQPAAVHVGDGAAARADRVDVEHRRLDRVAVHHRLARQPADPAGEQATSELVPPMSKVMRSRMPAIRPTACAATTPVDGPDSTVRTGSRGGLVEADDAAVGLRQVRSDGQAATPPAGRPSRLM